jgi:hypothetical protein
MLSQINWWHWWLPQFFISGFIWLTLAPTVGNWFLKWVSKQNQESLLLSKRAHESLRFIIGFIFISYSASFLVPLHKLALPILLCVLILFKFYRRGPNLKLESFDIYFTGGILIAALLSPTSTDSPLGVLQFSFFHDKWPLDWAKDFDTHLAIPMLFGFWFEKIPLTQSLAVQSPFLALLVWRAVTVSWELLGNHFSFRISQRNKIILLLLLISTVYFRKQIHVKASPIGGLFAVLFCFLITQPRAKKFAPLTGLVLAATFIFGDYGALITIPLLGVLIIIQSWSVQAILPALPWAIVFVSADVLRKTLIITSGSSLGVVITLFILAGLAFLTQKISHLSFSKTKQSIGEIIFFCSTLFCAICSNIFFTPHLLSESAQFNLYQWSIGREGLLLILVLAFLFKNRTHLQARVLIVFCGIQLLMFSLFRFIDGTPQYHWPNPNDLWWNLMKNSMMISIPLMVSLVASVIIAQWMDRLNLKILKQKLYVGILFLAILLLQDPLVKNVHDGPLAPHAPRLPALLSLSQILWQVTHKKAISSVSGNMISNYFAIPEPSLLEKIYELQKMTPKRLSVCIDPKLNPVGIADFDVETYSINNPTGALGTIRRMENCSLYIRAKKKTMNCRNQENLIFTSPTALLCQAGGGG